MGQKPEKTPSSEPGALTVFHQAGQTYKSDFRSFSDECILKEEKQAFSPRGEIIPHCFVSWHHLNWWKGIFGSLYGDYVFILLAEMKVMMRKEIRISSGKAQENAETKIKRQHLLIHQDKIQPYIRIRLNLKWLKKATNETGISNCKMPMCSFSAPLMIHETLKSFRI